MSARLLRAGAGVHGRVPDARAADRAVPEPDRAGLWAEQLDPRQLPRAGGVCAQRRAHRAAAVGDTGHGHRGALASQLRRRARLAVARSEEHTSELQSLMRISYAVFCLKKKKTHQNYTKKTNDSSRHD